MFPASSPTVPKKSKPLHWLSSLILAVLLLAATLALVTRGPGLRAQLTGGNGSSSSELPNLPRCRRIPELFPENRADPEGRQWDASFTRTVEDVFEELEEERTLSCADNAKALAPRSLQALAAKLPQWKGKSPLFAADVPPVLLDYLEAYGCALKEKGLFLPLDLQQASSTPLSMNATKTFTWFQEGENRLATLRETLRRSLLITLGREKLSPLERSFVCLNRASKDLRNLFGLLAEAGACIPVRTWDARGTLRQFPAGASATPLAP